MKIITGLIQADIESIIKDGFIPIRDEFGKLLCRYNPQRNMIEIQRRGIKTTIDLKQYQRSAMSDTPMYNGPMTFANGITLEEVLSDSELRGMIEHATRERLTQIVYNGRVIELSYNESATSAAQTGGDLWQKS